MVNLSVLKKLSRAKKYFRGSVISRGNIGTEMFIVLKGEVGVYSNYRTQNEVMSATASPGEFFGESALFLEKSSPSTFVALSDVIALMVDRNTVLSFIKDEPEMAVELMKAMCSRLDSLGTARDDLSGSPLAEPKAALQEDTAAQVVQETTAPSESEAAQAEETQTKESPVSIPEGFEQDVPVPPADAAQSNAQNFNFSLFPQGHGNYLLPLKDADEACLMDSSCICPICGKQFIVQKVRNSKLILESTDSDMRNRYKGIEPLYYDVVTCPNCLYSALTEMFNSPDKSKAEVLRELEIIKPEAQAVFGAAMDTPSVFAGYYLALYCAPKCFLKPHLAKARLLLKLSRIYQDCGDMQMEEMTTKRALDAYMYVYENIEIPPNQEQQLCMVIGELCLKSNDLKSAQDFFFKARNSAEGTPLLKNKAQDRILDIREMAGKSDK